MKVYFSEHAKEQAKARSGHPLRRLARRIEQHIRLGTVYRPSERVARDVGEMWIVVDGPKGKATAVVQVRDGDAHVITVRDSSQFSQGEQSLRGHGHFPFRDLLVGVLA